MVLNCSVSYHLRLVDLRVILMMDPLLQHMSTFINQIWGKRLGQLQQLIQMLSRKYP